MKGIYEWISSLFPKETQQQLADRFPEGSAYRDRRNMVRMLKNVGPTTTMYQIALIAKAYNVTPAFVFQQVWSSMNEPETTELSDATVQD